MRAWKEKECVKESDLYLRIMGYCFNGFVPCLITKLFAVQHSDWHKYLAAWMYHKPMVHGQVK
jgi:hypothetical protein